MKINKIWILILSALFPAIMTGCVTRNAAAMNGEEPPLVQTVMSEVDEDVNVYMDAYIATPDIIVPDILTFRAEVLGRGPDIGFREDALLPVRSITSVVGHNIGGRYFISRNDFIVILDADGEPVSYLDVPAGAIVDIAFYGLIFERNPGIIPGAISVQIVYDTNMLYTQGEAEDDKATLPALDKDIPAVLSGAERALLLAEHGISEYGWQAAKEFLSEFTTIFTGVPTTETVWCDDGPPFHIETGYFHVNLGFDGVEWHVDLTDEIPYIYLGLTGNFDEWGNTEWGFFNRDGSLIEDAPWLMWGDLFANGFSLISIDDSGIPAIFIYHDIWRGSGDGGRPTRLFKYIDGEYRQMTNIVWQQIREQIWEEEPVNAATYAWNTMSFLRNPDGNLILSARSYFESAAFLHIDFNGTEAETTLIATRTWVGEWTDDNSHIQWTNHVTGESGIPMTAYDEAWRRWNPLDAVYIPGTDTPLYIIPRLTALQEDLYAVIRESLFG